ncbi:AMP-binding protein [Streptomyces sp. NPDC048270]|uniref:AMP-binding protein n=1 Tax=Streptomyces sp. NPDC048270 TaxID=3154615 RepID=UPI0033EBF3E3
MTQGSESARSGRRTADTVLHRFEQWARDTPEAPALIAGPDSLTYGQLDARAGRLAGLLLAAGLAPGARVAVGTGRQAELVAALLAVLKAGGAYLVIDVEDPRTGRRQLAGAEPDLLLTRAAHQAALDDGSGLRVIRFGEEAAAAGGRPAPTPGPGPARTAAVLFSGAAEPRAVPVGQGLLLAAYEAWAQAVRPAPQDRHLITARPDVTAFAAGWTRALCSGGALVLPSRAPWRGEEITAAVESEQVTVLHAGPADAVHLLAPPEAPRIPVPRTPLPQASVPQARPAPGGAVRSLRLLAFSGDRLHLDDMASLHAVLRPGVRVLNVYGTAETAGAGTWFELPQLPRPLDGPEERSLLGTAFPGCRAEVRDGEVHLTPPGGGEPVPTGDLGVLREDGLLEFRGRIRDRITLPDGRSLDPHPVESVIRGHQGIGAVIVNGVDGGRGPRSLVAYASPRPGAPAWPPGGGLPDVEDLRAHLAGKLPREQVPLRVVPVRALPRNRAGQEDRAALPLPILGAAARPAGSKSGRPAVRPAGPFPSRWAAACGGLGAGFVGLVLTKVFWPGSTDLTGVPQPWAFLFLVLYLVECAAFGIGLVFLFAGRARMPRRGRGRRLTGSAHLAVAYLLMAWWPQDNLYRLAAKQDWPRQAALVYTFNIPLMIAAAVVAAYVVAKPPDPFDFDD